MKFKRVSNEIQVNLNACDDTVANSLLDDAGDVFFPSLFALAVVMVAVELGLLVDVVVFIIVEEVLRGSIGVGGTREQDLGSDFL